MLLTKGRAVTRMGGQEGIAVRLAQSSVELWMTAAVMVLYHRDVLSWMVAVVQLLQVTLPGGPCRSARLD